MALQPSKCVIFIFLLAVIKPLCAHDFQSGPNMGSPPRISELEQKVLQLIPADANEISEKKLKGVFERAKMWPQYQELIVCFLSGTRKARARVAAMAVDWMNYVNLRLNFGDLSDPQSCTGNGTEHIKVDFLKSGPDSGHWSYVGIDSWRFPHSMNLDGYGNDALPDAESEFRSVVLHEFGHALGFLHEHQSPAAKCDAEFDPEKLAAWAKRMGWSESDVKTNLRRLQPTDSLEFTRHDTESIMHYSLPAELFRDGRNNRCWVPKNLALSENDKKFAASLYPPHITSAKKSPDQSERLGSPAPPRDSKTTEEEYRVGLRRSFTEILEQTDLKQSEAAELSRKFDKAITELRSNPKADEK